MERLEDRTLLSNLTVTTLADSVDADGFLSLREAILIANDDTGATSFEGISSADAADTISFDPSLFTAGPQTIDLTIVGDTSVGDSAFVINSDVTIEGPAGPNGLTLSAAGSLTTMRLFVVTAGGDLTLNRLTLTGGLADGASGTGGALYNAGTLVVSNSTITGNSANSGGGIRNAGGTVTLTGSTLHGNQANSGGGISNGPGVASTFHVVNSTISGNTAGTGGSGGGISNGFMSTITLTNSTVTGNRAGSSGGGLSAGGTEHLFNSIIAGNFTLSGTPSDISSLVTTKINNLIGDFATRGGITHGVDGNIVGNGGAGVIDLLDVFVDANNDGVIDADDLSDNGGPTLTLALVDGSPAIDAGDDDSALDAGGNPLAFDQRGAGFPRIVGSAVDMGAFELLQNQPPEVSDFAKSGAEDNPLLFSAADFTDTFTDPDGDALVAVRIESMPNPLHGTLELNGDAVTAGQEIAASDLGGLVFVPALDFNGQASFTYTASDGISGFALVPATVTLHILSAQEQAEVIAAQVAELAAEGILNNGQQQALKLKLKGNNGDAGKAQAFLNKVEAFVQGGILTPEQAEALLEAGTALLTTVET
jgi:CSLREA domain-containing protein